MNPRLNILIVFVTIVAGLVLVLMLNNEKDGMFPNSIYTNTSQLFAKFSSSISDEQSSLSSLVKDIQNIKTLLQDNSSSAKDKISMKNITDEILEIKKAVLNQRKNQRNTTPPPNPSNILSHDKLSHRDDNKTAADLFNKIRVLCFIPCSEKSLKEKAEHVMKTWGQHCNKVIFFSEKSKEGIETVKLGIADSGNYDLTKKMFASFKYIYDHYLNDYDWFMKADTDTYVVVENLRYLLSAHQPTEPIYFGHHFKVIVKNGYMSGGGGYAMSREVIKRFGEKGHDQLCRGTSGTEDVEVGKCMEKIGVLPGDSRDKLGRSRFHCLTPGDHVHGSYPDWYRQYDKYGAKQGIESISDYAISFHFLSVKELYMLEFYIYHLRPYGILMGLQELNGKPPS